MRQILVVDDEIGIRELLSEILSDEGYDVQLAENAGAARAFRSQARPDLVLLDIWMPDTDGITLLKEWASTGQLTMPVVMMSGHGTIDTAVEATRIGAYDFLEKPIALQKLLATVGKAITRGEQRPQAAALGMLGRTPVVQELKQRLERIAASRSAVLVQGAPGCAFEACARILHTPSMPWTAVELGAQVVDAPLDLLQASRGGTLLVRDIAEFSKLEQRGLYVLLSQADRYNVRVVCCSTQPLAERVAAGAFDDRVYQMLGATTIQLPRLREQRDDIPELAAALLSDMVEQKQVPPRHFSTAALNALRNYEWPGNLSELKSVVQTLANTAAGEQISLEETVRVVPQSATPDVASVLQLDAPLRDARDAFERIYFEYHLAREGGNISRVAEVVGLERTHLYRKLKHLGIKTSRKHDE
ncbi:MAG: sigma-54 dependent transcriptional regulator [Burkholderiales bacterium]|nr:sigma-54 dependent transcriptional regulator [Burkholderiales bacterium]